MTVRIREYLGFVTHKDATLPPGAYYFGIIACAAYFESALEDMTVYWCRSKSENDGDFYSRILRKIEKDLTRATGLEGWKTWLSVLFDIDLPMLLKGDWTDLEILFRLRNQLAHGRTTKFSHHYRSNGEFLGVSTKASLYEAPLQYLIRKNVVTIRDRDVPTGDCILTADVVTHFLALVDSVFSKLQSHPALSELKSYGKPSLVTLTRKSDPDEVIDFPCRSGEEHPYDLVSRVPTSD